MTETTSMKEACSCCGSSTWTEAHYTGGSLVCAACCAEIRKVQESRGPSRAGVSPFGADHSGRPFRGVKHERR
jgi:hypothetical protein